MNRIIQRAFSVHVTLGDKQAFFAAQSFAVVGASTDRSKFGNKVMRCYQQHNKLVMPVSKKEKVIEGEPCISSLSQISNIPFQNLGVSVITPPNATLAVLAEGHKLGVKNFFLQPGTSDATVDALISTDAWRDINVVKGCVLVELGFSDN